MQSLRQGHLLPGAYTPQNGRFFSGFSASNVDPLSCGNASILSFLQEVLDGGSTLSTLKVLVAAIAVYHVPITGQSIGKNDLVVRFLRGARRLNPPHYPHTIPSWDLSTVLRALKTLSRSQQPTFGLSR